MVISSKLTLVARLIQCAVVIIWLFSSSFSPAQHSSTGMPYKDSCFWDFLNTHYWSASHETVLLLVLFLLLFPGLTWKKGKHPQFLHKKKKNPSAAPYCSHVIQSLTSLLQHSSHSPSLTRNLINFTYVLVNQATVFAPSFLCFHSSMSSTITTATNFPLPSTLS